MDAEEAARRWAERDDIDSEYRILSGDEVTVSVIEDVRAEAGDEAQKFSVSGESVPAYYATKAT